MHTHKVAHCGQLLLVHVLCVAENVCVSVWILVEGGYCNHWLLNGCIWKSVCVRCLGEGEGVGLRFGETWSNRCDGCRRGRDGVMVGGMG